jgi:hypothetical protein
MRWIWIASGSALRRCWSSWSVVVLGTSSPCRLPAGVQHTRMCAGEGRERTGGEAADDAGAADGGVHDGHDVAELGLERRVEIRAALHGSKAVRICELREHADVRRVLEL